jgi:hypothetical protein
MCIFHFRVSGDIDEVNILKTRCEQWIEPTSCTEPHTPASLLKLWYRELHEPIIPDDFYDECVSCCQDVCSCISIVHRLPALNRLVFSYLIRFLQVSFIELWHCCILLYQKPTRVIAGGQIHLRQYSAALLCLSSFLLFQIWIFCLLINVTFSLLYFTLSWDLHC